MNCINTQTINNLVELLNYNNISIVTHALFESDFMSQLRILKVKALSDRHLPMCTTNIIIY